MRSNVDFSDISQPYVEFWRGMESGEPGGSAAGSGAGPLAVSGGGAAVKFESVAPDQITGGDTGVAQCNYRLCDDASHGAPCDGFESDRNSIWRGAGPSGTGSRNVGHPDGTRLAGTAVAGSETTADGGVPASDGPDAPVITGDTDANKGTETPSPSPVDGEFTGSAEPSGQDISPAQEKDLITSGWK
jgi:hypothetical protein